MLGDGDGVVLVIVPRAKIARHRARAPVYAVDQVGDLRVRVHRRHAEGLTLRGRHGKAPEPLPRDRAGEQHWVERVARRGVYQRISRKRGQGICELVPWMANVTIYVCM